MYFTKNQIQSEKFTEAIIYSALSINLSLRETKMPQNWYSQAHLSDVISENYILENKLT